MERIMLITGEWFSRVTKSLIEKYEINHPGTKYSSLVEVLSNLAWNG